MKLLLVEDPRGYLGRLFQGQPVVLAPTVESALGMLASGDFGGAIVDALLVGRLGLRQVLDASPCPILAICPSRDVATMLAAELPADHPSVAGRLVAGQFGIAEAFQRIAEQTQLMTAAIARELAAADEPSVVRHLRDLGSTIDELALLIDQASTPPLEITDDTPRPEFVDDLDMETVTHRYPEPPLPCHLPVIVDRKKKP